MTNNEIMAIVFIFMTFAGMVVLACFKIRDEKEAWEELEKELKGFKKELTHPERIQLVKKK